VTKIKQDKTHSRGKKRHPKGRKPQDCKKNVLFKEQKKFLVQPPPVTGKMKSEKPGIVSKRPMSLRQEIRVYMNKLLPEEVATKVAKYLVSGNNNLDWAKVLRLREKKEEEDEAIFYLLLKFLTEKKIIDNEHEGAYGVLDSFEQILSLSPDRKVFCVFRKKEDAFKYIDALRKICRLNVFLGRYGPNGWKKESEEKEETAPLVSPVKVINSSPRKKIKDTTKDGSDQTKEKIDWQRILIALKEHSPGGNEEIIALKEKEYIIPYCSIAGRKTSMVYIPRKWGRFNCFSYNGIGFVFLHETDAKKFGLLYSIMHGEVPMVGKLSAAN